MKRTSLRWLMLVAVIAIASIIAGVPTASAQGPVLQCPDSCYTVDLTNLPRPDCYPLAIRTQWADGSIWPNLLGWPGYPGPGIYRECTKVAPGTPLVGINVCGIMIPPVPGYFTVQCPNGCLLCIAICRDLHGCLYIKVYPGPCTQQIAMPCP